MRCEEVGMADASDLAHLEYATKESRVVISQDADFLRLHQNWQAENKSHSGIMYCVPQIQGKQNTGKIIQEVMTYYQLIAEGAGNIETDIANQVFYIS